MPILVQNIRIGLEEGLPEAVAQAAKRLGIGRSRIAKASLAKKSLDARHKEIAFVVSVALELTERETEAAYAASAPFTVYRPKEELRFLPGKGRLPGPVAIAGFGPAGIFAAHTLALQGYRPIVFERGSRVEKRAGAVERFWREGVLDESSNVQFGEGGAGAFSDGKLTTRISDSRCGYVLEQFVRHGAPEEILTAAKPHIGTDRLRSVIASLREEILSHGGEIRFETPVEDVGIRDGKVVSLTAGGEETACGCLILAVGHSARDTFGRLFSLGVPMEPKPFSAGVRIEQLQADIDRGLYGSLAGHPALPKGEYQLSCRKGERCVYTFCMCPGGYVIPASSSAGTVVTNGMSEHARDGENANAALVVSVGPADYGNAPLDGMRFQQRLEERAYRLAGESYRAPAMSVREFLSGKGTLHEGKVRPSYALGVEGVSFEKLFPPEITDMLRTGLAVFQKKLRGFGDGDGVMTGPETRTSSPVRIVRNGELMSAGVGGLYPCGEGAGYAGGIVSAAVDGVRVAQEIISRYAPPD